MKTGILLIAVGHHNYGRLAGNLAASIRMNGCNLPIVVATHGDTLSHLTPTFRELFETIQIPDEYLMHNGERCWIKAKSKMYDISPFENTLFLDADIILINNGKINEMLSMLEDKEFSIKNSGFKTFGEVTDPKAKQWASIHEVRDEYEFSPDVKIWDVHSECIWFKKTKSNETLFNEWAKQFEDARVENIVFADCIPDELPLWIAMCMHGIDPDISNWHPTYWPFDGKSSPGIKDLRGEYIGVSVGGSVCPEFQVRNYNVMVDITTRYMNLDRTFKYQNKKRWLPERSNI
jgi:hypothetical protein